MDEFTTTAAGFDELETKIARLIEIVSDLRGFWPLVVPLFVAWEGEQFEQEGGFWGDPWAPLSTDYLAWKTQHYPGKGILVAEGELKRAAQSPRRIATPTTLVLRIEPFTKRRGPGAGRTIDPIWFQKGTSTMPARPLLPEEEGLLTPVAERQLAEVADAWVADTMLRLGL